MVGKAQASIKIAFTAIESDQVEIACSAAASVELISGLQVKFLHFAVRRWWPSNTRKRSKEHRRLANEKSF